MEQEKLLITKEVAEYLDIAISTLMQYRVNRTGPIYIKLGQLVRYRKADMDAWLKARENQEKISLFNWICVFLR